MFKQLVFVRHHSVFFVIPSIAWVEEDSGKAWSYQLSWAFWSLMAEFQRKER